MPWLIETRAHRRLPWEFYDRRPSRWLAYVLAGWLFADGWQARVRKERP